MRSTTIGASSAKAAKKVRAAGWLSWQVVPTVLTEMLSRGEPKKAERVTKAFMQMKKFDIAALERAYAGSP